MKERALNFTRNEDESIVEDKDGELLKKVNKAYSDIQLNLEFCIEQLKEGKLTVGMMETHLSLSEHYIIDFLKVMDYDSILQKDVTERHENVKSLNIENRELRRQLGEKVTNEDAKEKMKNLSTSLRDWWRSKGFGHTSEINYSEYGSVNVKFSGMVCGGHNPHDSKESKKKYLSDLGFIYDDEYIIFNDKCLELLTVLIKEKYPSASIIETRVWHGRNESSKLRDIDIHINSLDDLTD